MVCCGSAHLAPQYVKKKLSALLHCLKTVGVAGTVRKVSIGPAQSAKFCLADKTLYAFAVSVRELSAVLNCWKNLRLASH
jgi:hypothetical protein